MLEEGTTEGLWLGFKEGLQLGLKVGDCKGVVKSEDPTVGDEEGPPGFELGVGFRIDGWLNGKSDEILTCVNDGLGDGA